MAQACETCFDNKTTQDGCEECSFFSPQEHRLATIYAIHILWAMKRLIKENCYGCRAKSDNQEDHDLCKKAKKKPHPLWGLKEATKSIKHRRVMEQFRRSVDFRYYQIHHIFNRSWFKQVWTSRPWLHIIKRKIYQLQHFKL